MPETIHILIPTFNRSNLIKETIDSVINQSYKFWVLTIVDNNSSDQTRKSAELEGATVLDETRQGYGFACLKGLDYIRTKNPDLVVFLDADYSDYPEQIHDVLKPILQDDYDFVIGSRALGKKESGSMTPQQIFGNWLATFLIKIFYGVKYTDLGPFRAIKWDCLEEMKMKDLNS